MLDCARNPNHARPPCLVGPRGRSGGCRLLEYGILAPLDAVDDLCRLAPALLDRLALARAQGHALEAGRSPRLDDIGLAAGGVDPHTEAGQVAVPEDGILAVDRQSVDDALAQSECASPRHSLARLGSPSSNRTRAALIRGPLERIYADNARGNNTAYQSELA